MDKNYVAKVPTITVHIGPMGFHRYASEFQSAARAFDRDATFSPVPYYLYCHSVELGFKAFLLGKSVPEKELKSREIGHDLVKALNRSTALGLDQYVTITADHDAQVQKANEYYNTKGFEYFQVPKAVLGYRDLPDLAILDDLAAALITGLEQYCTDVS